MDAMMVDTHNSQSHHTCEQQSLVLILLPCLLATLHFFGWDFSRGAVGRGCAVTVGSDNILIAVTVSCIHS